MHFLISNQYGCDVALRIRDGDKFADFKAHQFVLNMSSVLFEKLLQDSKNRFIDPATKLLVLTLPNTNSQFFRMFLRFLYTRKVQLESFSEAYELFKLSKQYGISDLNSICNQFISNSVTISNALEVKEFAINYNIDSLRDECSTIIRKNTGDVLKMSKWKLEWVKTLLDEPELSISEIELFRLVETWINTYFGDVENTVHRNYLWKTLIPKFCYLNMTADEFLEGPVKTGMISKEESLAIIGHIVSDKKFHLPFPSSFKRLKRRLTGQQDSATLLHLIYGQAGKTESDKEPSEDKLKIDTTKKLKTCSSQMLKGEEREDQTKPLQLTVQTISGKSTEKVVEAELPKVKSTEVMKVQEKPLARKVSASPPLEKPLTRRVSMNPPLVGKPSLTSPGQSIPDRSSVEDDLQRAHNFIKKTSVGEHSGKNLTSQEASKIEKKNQGQISKSFDEKPIGSLKSSNSEQSGSLDSTTSDVSDECVETRPKRYRKPGTVVIKELKRSCEQKSLHAVRRLYTSGNEYGGTKNRRSTSKSARRRTGFSPDRKKSPKR